MWVGRGGSAVAVQSPKRPPPPEGPLPNQEGPNGASASTSGEGVTADQDAHMAL